MVYLYQCKAKKKKSNKILTRSGPGAGSGQPPRTPRPVVLKKQRGKESKRERMLIGVGEIVADSLPSRRCVAAEA